MSGVGVAALAAVALATGVMAAGVQNKDKKDKPDAAAQAQAQAQAQEVQAVVRVADAAMAGQPAPSDFAMQYQNDFIKAQGGRVWLPITLTIDPAKLTNPAGEPAVLYVRVAPRGMTTPPAAQSQQNDKDKKKKDKKDKNAPPDAKGMPSPYPFEDVSFLELQPAAPGQPIRVLRGVGAPPGSYDLYLVLKERPAQPGAPAKTSVLKQPIEVPNFTNGEFSTSSIILAEKVEQLQAPLPSDQQTEHPYTFGQTQIVVSPEHKFKKTDELIVLMQIYNPMVSPEKKFNIEATYTFFRTGSGGESRFNATEPQSFTPENMGASFDPSNADRSIQAGQGIPLQSFPEGSYRLEIKVTDKLSSKVLTQSVNFSVSS